LIPVLFLIGTSLSLHALRVVGWRTMVAGLALWLFISVASLLAIRCLNLAS
jgi:Kef-type K+ transport system membrane component KefB